MVRQNNYEGHLLSNITNENDQSVLLKAAEFQCSERVQEALFEYGRLTIATRRIPGASIYEVRLMLMKGDFQKASSRIDEIIDPNTDLRSSTLDALLILLKCYCGIFIHLKLQEAVDVARQVRQVWLDPIEINDMTDNFVSGTTFVPLRATYLSGGAKR
jgi:lipopolysaccharide biosynthesis regulator YciM